MVSIPTQCHNHQHIPQKTPQCFQSVRICFTSMFLQIANYYILSLSIFLNLYWIIYTYCFSSYFVIVCQICWKSLVIFCTLFSLVRFQFRSVHFHLIWFTCYSIGSLKPLPSVPSFFTYLSIWSVFVVTALIHLCSSRFQSLYHNHSQTLHDHSFLQALPLPLCTLLHISL